MTLRNGFPCLDSAQGAMWQAVNGDSSEVMPYLPDKSVGLTVTSIPFQATYTYSPSARDIGNVKSAEEFWAHMGWVTKELRRVMKPGRVVCLHVQNLPRYANRDEAGESGRFDFRGDTIRHFESAGFIYHSETTVWKDPQVQTHRNHSKGLLFVQLKRDSSWCWQAWADYLVVMRTPGANAEPIKTDVTEDEWIRFASPVWMDIRQTATLDGNEGKSVQKDAEDEKHLCLSRGSLVLTRSGYLPIEEVEVGDLVLTHAGRWQRVVAKQCNGRRPVVRVTAQGVAGLCATPDHPIYARSGVGSGRWPGMPGGVSNQRATAKAAQPEWTQAADSLGSYVNLPLPPVEDSPLAADDWWVVGRWLGDGHLSGHLRSGRRYGHEDLAKQIVISCGKHERDALVARLGARTGHVAEVRTGFQIAVKDPHRHLWRVISQCGHGASEKRVPGEALALDQEKAEALLSGYLSADGHYVAQYDRWTASSVSRRLLLGMAMVAQRARGVVASVYAGRDAGTTIIEERAVNTKQDWVLCFRNSPGYRQSGWIDGSGAWKKVRSIADAGEAEVWDIQVAGDESFVAEGCVVHNCPLQMPFIERCVRLWSNPGDLVFDPFGGIMSTPVGAIRHGRRGLGIELKPSYWRQGVGYLKAAETAISQPTLFDALAAAMQPGAETMAGAR